MDELEKICEDLKIFTLCPPYKTSTYYPGEGLPCSNDYDERQAIIQAILLLVTLVKDLENDVTRLKNTVASLKGPNSNW